jgi:hypothetical protein
VTVREGGRVLTSFRTARPNVEETRWYSEQEQIVVKSRGNHGLATVELFESRTGRLLGTVMAYEAASGPPWARSMAEGGEEVPATGPVPGNIIADCLAALRSQIPDRSMNVIRAERGETSYFVDVAVEGVPQPWRCYHDGTRCTGTEYQGEG